MMRIKRKERSNFAKGFMIGFFAAIIPAIIIFWVIIPILPKIYPIFF